MSQTKQSRWFFAILMLLAAVAAYILLRPFLALIVMSLIIALIYRPVYKILLNRFKKKAGLASTVTILIIFLSVIVPVTAVLGIVTSQVLSITRDIRESGTISSQAISLESVVTEVNSVLDQIPVITYRLSEEEITDSIEGLLAPVGQFAVNNLIAIGGQALNAFTGLLIFIAVVHAVLVNHDRIIRILHSLSPLPNEVDKLYFDKLASMATAMVKGSFVVALAASLATGIFAWIAGIDYVALIMLIAFILSLLPLGAGFLIFPLGIAQIISGSTAAGLFLIISFVLVTANIDNIMRPMLVPKDAELHPALTVLALFGGLQAFGFLGLIFGPIVMIFIVTTLDVYVRDFKDRPLAGRPSAQDTE
ncbi:MAG: putative inner membrane protein [candidate division WS6 bacterium OLB20]|uniref:Putative inner membrane protein n=1 Tax=candidate division WS6 bacterium OLB20 TaxID=1617426 RepID=A0A136M0D8_9BACT|nr:MAG: putative inner membrane protein [candidate division WS6 bacterium OLB20]